MVSDIKIMNQKFKGNLDDLFNSLQYNRKMHLSRIYVEIKEFLKFDTVLSEEDKEMLLFIGKYHDIGYSELINYDNKPHEEVGYHLFKELGYSKTIYNIILLHGLKVNNDYSLLNENERYMMNILNYFDIHVDYNGKDVSFLTRIKNMDRREKAYDYDAILENEKWMIDTMARISKPLFFLDVDNTILIDHKLSELNQQAIKENKEQIILCTGKIPNSLNNLKKQCHLENQYTISLNGGVISKNNQHLLMGNISKYCEKIITELIANQIHFVAYAPERIYIPHYLHNEETELLKKLGDYVNPVTNQYQYDEIVKVLVFVEEEDIDVIKVLKRLASENYINLTRTSPHFLEFTKKSATKGKAIKRVCRKLNHYYRNSVSIGDSMNDYSMLEITGLAFIMPNSSNELLKTGNEIISHDKNDAVAVIINKYKDGLFI